MPMRVCDSGAEETYDDAQREFLVACEDWRRKFKRKFLANTEILLIVMQLGYRKIEPAPEPAGPDPVAELPLPFASVAFKEAWGEYVEFRKVTVCRTREPLHPDIAKRYLRLLAGMGERMAIRSCRQSVEKDVVGIYPVKENAAQ